MHGHSCQPIEQIARQDPEPRISSPTAKRHWRKSRTGSVTIPTRCVSADQLLVKSITLSYGDTIDSGHLDDAQRACLKHEARHHDYGRPRIDEDHGRMSSNLFAESRLAKVIV